MNIARLGLLGVAVLAAGGAAFLMRGMTHKDAKVKLAVVEVPSTQVLVAAHVLDPGTRLRLADVRWQKWPGDAVNASYFTSKAAPHAADDAAGSIVHEHLEPGEPLTAASMKAHVGFMAAMLTPGMRAVSIKISEESAASGLIMPGDFVDVVTVRKMEDGAPEGSFVAKTVLENVRVRAIDQNFKQEENDKPIVGKTATLELNTHQVEVLEAADAAGTLTLTLRSAPGSDLTAAIRPASSGDDTVHVVRYGHASRAIPALSGGGSP